MKPRTKARGIALQALYEIDSTDHGIGTVLDNLFTHSPLEDRLEDFTRDIVIGVVPLREILDETLAEHAPEWPIDQISIIDRNILRVALWEISIMHDTPLKVAINEAVELAKKFGSDSSPRFVNGVLGSLADHENEIQLSIKAKITALDSQRP